VLPVGLAFAADLVPEALEQVSWRVVALVGVASTGAMLALQAALS
jgi:hypothetical protein